MKNKMNVRFIRIFLIVPLAASLMACSPRILALNLFNPNLGSSKSGSPLINSISPASGSISGGGLVTIIGQNFDTSNTVTIGDIPCTNVTLLSPNSLQCTLGATNTEGTWDVVVTDTVGASSTLSSSFTSLLANVCVATQAVQSFDAVQAQTGTPNETPLRIISSTTGPNLLTGLMFDKVHNELIFPQWNAGFTFYTASPWDDGTGHSDSGTQQITSTASYGATTNPFRGTYDPANDYLYIPDNYPEGNNQPVVSTYSRSTGALIRNFYDSRNITNMLRGFAYNSSIHEFAVMNDSQGSIDFYPSNSSGWVSPTRSLVGGNTTIPAGTNDSVDLIYSSTTDQLIVASHANSQILGFDWPTGTGNLNVAPTWIIGGANTNISGPYSVEINPTTISGNPDLIVLNSGNSITFYPLPETTASGTYDIAPSRTIQGANTQINISGSIWSVAKLCR